MRIHVQGFRCHENTLIEVNSPITAFCGLNGTGKSTLLQLAAAAYQSPDTKAFKHYYIKNFMVVGTLDPNPFVDGAAVEYRFWQVNRSLKPLTISRNATTKRWQGYARRPERHVFFAGAGLYLPKIEQRDFITRHAHQLDISEYAAVSDDNKSWTSRVLSQSYEIILSNTVKYSGRSGKIISVERSGLKYSEAHMGYGEARSQFLIGSLELLPEKSLVLIEEPETSLHPSAQFEFGSYLVDVSRRRGHQILLTTHSEFILEALPSESSVYLHRKQNMIVAIAGLTPLRAKSLMAQGHVKALHVLVEDKCAKGVLTEIIRKGDPVFLDSIGIHDVGSAEVIATTVRALKNTGLPVAAVRDADQTPIPRENIFKLPGTWPPEKELFGCEAFKQHVANVYGISLNDFTGGLTGVDHHEWFCRLAERVNQDESAMISEAARAYSGALAETESSNLIDLLKEASRR